MPLIPLILLLFLICPPRLLAGTPEQPWPGPEVRIGQLGGESAGAFNPYANALPSLLRHIRKHTTLQVAEEPLRLENFADPRLLEVAFVYANFADRPEWVFSPDEVRLLRFWLDRGGFLLIDAGITAAFLRDSPGAAQHHSYAEWEASPEIRQAFAALWPDAPFEPLRRSDPLYTAFYAGLPDTSQLPDTVRQYTIEEKWPDGTYSAAALRRNGRIAVLTTPIIAMGWGKNSLDQWETTIRFRVLESGVDMEKLLASAAYGGPRFEVAREDGGTDIVFCQNNDLPAWVQEPGGRWRVFRYYDGREISDFAHHFYTRLGTNIIVHALTVSL